MRDDQEPPPENVVNLRSIDGGKDDPPAPPTRTITVNRRKYRTDQCRHRGPFQVDTTLACVECGDCGAMLNPLYVLEVLSCHEAYWNARMRDLREFIAYLDKEIEGRVRTKCVHCGNMTPIRFNREPPRTWVPQPEG